MKTKTIIIKQFLLLIIVFILGILSLILVHLFFQDLLESMDKKSLNLKTKVIIGEYLRQDILSIQSDFYELATTSINNKSRYQLQDKILKKVQEMDNIIYILEHGGQFKRVLNLNLVNQSKNITTHVYTKNIESENMHEVDIVAIALKPKLIEFKKMLNTLNQLLLKQEIFLKNNNSKSFIRNAIVIRRFYQRTPAFFQRIIENTSRLLYEGQNELKLLTQHIKLEKKRYEFIESILISSIIILSIIFGLLILKNIIRNSKQLIYLNKELNNKLNEVKKQEASIRGILDAQPDIIVVSNGGEMIDANLALVDFFDGYDSFDDFKEKHACICDYFQEVHNNEEYVIDKNYPEGLWFEHILSNPNTLFKVAMKKNNQLHYFTITAKRKYILKKSFIIIISLHDITKELLINHELKSLNDNLENIVQEKTKDLEELNKNLSNRVQIELMKNREKDKRLIQQSRYASMGEMIGNIAHQWRQPLSAISSTASSLEIQKSVGLLTDENLDQSLDNIKKYVHFLDHTIEDFRAFFKQDKKKDLFDMVHVLNNSINIIQATYKSNAIEIKQEANEKLYFSLGFPNELAQVFVNILNNSKDACLEHNVGKERLVFINAFYKDEYNVIEIYDNAKGIPNEIIQKVFDPYFTTKHQSQGTGIGLYMSKFIIEKHMKGLLEVQNKDFKVEGKNYFGACFRISLPCHKEQKS